MPASRPCSLVYHDLFGLPLRVCRQRECSVFTRYAPAADGPAKISDIYPLRIVVVFLLQRVRVVSALRDLQLLDGFRKRIVRRLFPWRCQIDAACHDGTFRADVPVAVHRNCFQHGKRCNFGLYQICCQRGCVQLSIDNGSAFFVADIDLVRVDVCFALARFVNSQHNARRCNFPVFADSAHNLRDLTGFNLDFAVQSCVRVFSVGHFLGDCVFIDVDPRRLGYNLSLGLRYPLMDAFAVHQHFGNAAPVLGGARSCHRLSHHRHVRGRVHEPRVILAGLLRAGPAALAAAGALAVHDAGHVLHQVGQGHRHLLRLLDLVGPAHLRDPFADRRAVFRQRHPAPPAHHDVVQRFPRAPAQLQPRHRYRHQRLAVPVQPLLAPGPQRILVLVALVRLDLAHHAPDVLVFARVVPADVDVVLPDRIVPRVHPAAVDLLPQGRDVPAHPHLAGELRRLLPDVQREGKAPQVVFPLRPVQAARHRLQRGEQVLPVEVVRVARVLAQVAQPPDVLLSQDVVDRLARRALRVVLVPGDVLRQCLAEQHPVLQVLDHVLQLDRPGLRLHLLRDRLHPPDDPGAGFRLILHPVVDRDRGRVRPHGHRGAAVPLLQVQGHAFRLEPVPDLQALSV